MKNDNPLGIGLIPNTTFIEKIYSFTSDLENRYDLIFSVRPGVSIPHLTLFQGRFENEKEIIKLVSEIENFSIKKQSIQGFSIWARKILFLDCEKCQSLQDLHNRVFKNLSSVNIGNSADPQNFVGITPGQQKSYIETGYPFSLVEYLPHFTLAHFREQPNPETLKEVQKLFQKFGINKTLTFDKLVIYRVGDKGRCKDIIYEKNCN
jgi:2'-5' RNA ligase